jgi:hypothetical protein
MQIQYVILGYGWIDKTLRFYFCAVETGFFSLYPSLSFSYSSISLFGMSCNLQREKRKMCVLPACYVLTAFPRPSLAAYLQLTSSKRRLSQPMARLGGREGGVHPSFG